MGVVNPSSIPNSGVIIAYAVNSPRAVPLENDSSPDCAKVPHIFAEASKRWLLATTPARYANEDGEMATPINGETAISEFAASG